MLLCSALSMQTMLNKQSNIKQLVTHTKQGINIHAKAYKVIAMQCKAIKHWYTCKQYKTINLHLQTKIINHHKYNLTWFNIKLHTQ